MRSHVLLTLILAAAGSFPLARPLAAGEPPVRESVDLNLVTLNRLELQPAVEAQAGLLPLKAKFLPNSVRLYLKPSQQINSLSRRVQKDAALIRRVLAPGSAEKDRLRDADRVAAAVRDWMDGSLPLDPDCSFGRSAALDYRLAWPSASEILEKGKADPDGRALAAVALLRALKVPARVAWAQGHLAAQYWAALAPPRRAPLPKRRKGQRGARFKRPLPPLGQWHLMDPALKDWDVDAWSLDPGNLALLRWRPQEDLTVIDGGWQRQAFAAGDSVAAHAAFDAALALGRLSPSAQAQDLSPLAEATLRSLTRGAATLWVLSVQRWRLQTLGAMIAMDPVDLTTPYRPQLAHWGRELPGPVRELELEAQGVWSDRAPRLRLHRGSLVNEWSSPPPALGVLHAYRVGLRRPPSVLQGQWRGDQVSGVCFRADNLSPRQGWIVAIDLSPLTGVAQTAVVDASGHFSATLTPTARALSSLLISMSKGGEDEVQRLFPSPMP